MSESTGSTGPPGVSRSAAGSCTRNIMRSGRTGISSLSSLRLIWPPSGQFDAPRQTAHRGPCLQDAPNCDYLRTQSARKTVMTPIYGSTRPPLVYPRAMTDPGAAIPQISHRHVQAGQLDMHIAEAGDGPLVLLLHGFPESWYSWRHQLTALAAAGFHAVAPDQRGYGRTGRPAAADAYTILHLTGDVIGLMDV